MNWFEKIKSPKLKKSKENSPRVRSGGLWKKCPKCNEMIRNDELIENFQVCHYCDYHFRFFAQERLNLIIDEGTFESFSMNLRTLDPLKFEDKISYKERLKNAEKKTGKVDGTFYGTGKVFNKNVAIVVMDFEFMGGSMGVVVGEKVSKVLEESLEKNIPAIVVSCSGGARMQEGILSLMQMGKISGLIKKINDKKIPFISVLTDPTTGGVAASFAMLGDVNISEPNCLIGFAGARVIEQSIHQKLPEGFQKSEFLKEHGFIDRVVHRKDLKKELNFFLEMFS